MTAGVRVCFRGVRGSIPSPGFDTARYGGNTSCVVIRTPEAHVLLDAGSGARAYGQKLIREEGASGHEITLLVSHTHWDHIQGIPFFAPAFIKGNKLTIAGPRTFNPGLERVITDQTRHSYFPLRLDSMGAGFTFRELSTGSYDDLVPGATVRTCITNHPVVDLAYRIETHGRTIVYLVDHECWTMDFARFVRRSSDANIMEIERMIHDDLAAGVRDFVRGADLLIADAVYTSGEYGPRISWGHSTFDQVWDLVEGASVGKLAFFHHDPNRTDDELEKIESAYRERNASERRVEDVFAAREDLEISW